MLEIYTYPIESLLTVKKICFIISLKEREEEEKKTRESVFEKELYS